MLPNDSTDPTPADIDALLGAGFKGFVIGSEVDERKAGKPVAVAINVNVHIKNGQQERTGRVPIHEIPFLRRLYHDGEVTILPGWVPGIDRRRLMKQSELDEEVKRLSETYVRVTQSGRTDFAADILGVTPTERKPALQKKMFEVAVAWKKLEAQAMERARAKEPDKTWHPLEVHGVVGQYLTSADFDALIAIVEPARNTLDAIDLDAINADDLSMAPATVAAEPKAALGAGAPADADDTPADPVADLLEAFGAAGFSMDDAQALAGMAIEHQGEVSDEVLQTRESMRTAQGKLNKTKAAAVRRVIESHRDALKALAAS